MTTERAYPYLVAGALFCFLLLSDWVLLGGPLLVVRRGMVGALALVAIPFVIRHIRLVTRTLAVPPLVFFAAFLAAGLALAPFAMAPASAALHTMVFAGLMLFAVAAAGTVSLATTFMLVRVALAVKLIGSLLLGLFGSRLVGSAIFGNASGSLNERHAFGGLFGNPNPLSHAAALYLLLAICHLVERGREWPKGRRGILEIAWYAVTIPVSAFLMWQSLSRTAWVGLAIVGLLLGLLGLWRTSQGGRASLRRALLLGSAALGALVATVVLLIWLNTSRGLVKPAGTTTERLWGHLTSGAILDASERPLFWKFALARIKEKPWTGYGMSSTPLLYAPQFGGRLEHSHNLELEATLYAGIPAASFIVLFVATSLKRAVWSFLAHRPLALSVAATLIFFYLLAQVEPLVFGSPYPSLPIALILVVHPGSPRLRQAIAPIEEAGPLAHHASATDSSGRA